MRPVSIGLRPSGTAYDLATVSGSMAVAVDMPMAVAAPFDTVGLSRKRRGLKL